MQRQEILPLKIRYRASWTETVDLPCDGFITHIAFIIRLLNGSRERFSRLLSESTVTIEADWGRQPFPKKVYHVLPRSPQTKFTKMNRNVIILRYHRGIDRSDPWDEKDAIPAKSAQSLKLKWKFGDKPLDTDGTIAVQVFEIID
jgi:hypothetical protein